MSLTISIGFLFIGLWLFLLALGWQCRRLLTAIRDKKKWRPSLFRAATQFATGSFMLITILLMPYRMLPFTFAYAILASAILAFAVVLLRRPPAREFTPYWYVSEPAPEWLPFKSSFVLPRKVSIEWLVVFLTCLSVSLSVFAAKYRSIISMRQREAAALAHLQSYGSIIEHEESALFPGRETIRLYELRLAGSQISDKDLAKLPDIINRESVITSLNLGATDITNEGLRHVGKLTTLTSLTLSGTRIDDAGLRHLSQLHRLRTLALRQTKVTGIAFPILDRRLEVDLSRCPLTASGLGAVASSKTSVLYLNETDIDDAIISEIPRFDSQIIDLTNTNVSRNAARELRGPHRVILGPLKISPTPKQ